MSERERIGCRMFSTLCICIFALIFPVLSIGQEYPTRPINLLIGFVPGGAVDPTLRVLAAKAGKILGQPFVISNNGGGGGSVALGIIANAKPDGYHLVGCTGPGLVWVPHFQSVSYKLEDFAFVMHYGAPYTGLAVKADSPFKTLKDLVEYAKKNPGKVTYSTTGVGSPMHVSMEFLAKQENLEWTHIPYKGNGPALTALLGGHVTAQVGGPEQMPHIRAGTIRLLAIHTEKRRKILPDVPTFRELGYDFVTEAVFMVAAPKGTPLAYVKKLDDALHQAMEEPEFIQLMENMGMEITYRNAEDLKKYLEDADARARKLGQDLKIEPQAEAK
ncbi:MAG TPA: tripartite tricarboxylate transporter substrate binding protein [Thermodesulfobacteriota bacterium]|nr:tripartite tricarboxylate transporter substrate binding protein [Thermodesulfobacteriota bacterium]